jgi:HSP20 family protein
MPSEIKGVPAKVERAIRHRRHVPPHRLLATFDDMLEDFRRNFRESIWAPWEWTPLEPYAAFRLPARETLADLVDAGSKFLVHAELPGIPKKKVEVHVTKDGIEISAETGSEKEEKEKGFVVRERSYSHIYKNLAFPEEVIPDKAESTLKDGVLEVTIPKKAPTPELKRHKVEVK